MTAIAVGHAADVDEVAVERVVAGRGGQSQLTVAERAEVVRVLHGRRCNDLLIARRTGMNPRTVLRIRQRLNLPAVAS